jgi:hypothetical protein
MTYIIEIEHRVAGIPCLIGVSSYEHTPGTYSSRADSDYEYYGWTDADWQILDRRGRPAAWLERKLKEDDRREIEDIIHEELSQ